MATSVKPGPTILRSTPWHAVQLCLPSKASTALILPGAAAGVLPAPAPALAALAELVGALVAALASATKVLAPR